MLFVYNQHWICTCNTLLLSIATTKINIDKLGKTVLCGGLLLLRLWNKCLGCIIYIYLCYARCRKLGVIGECITHKLCNINDSNIQISEVIQFKLSSVGNDNCIVCTSSAVEDTSQWFHGWCWWAAKSSGTSDVCNMEVVHGGVYVIDCTLAALVPAEVKRDKRNSPFATRTLLSWSLNAPNWGGGTRGRLITYVTHCPCCQITRWETIWEFRCKYVYVFVFARPQFLNGNAIDERWETIWDFRCKYLYVFLFETPVSRW